MHGKPTAALVAASRSAAMIAVAEKGIATLRLADADVYAHVDAASLTVQAALADALNAALSEYTGQKMRGKEHSKLREKLRAPIERVVTHKKQREQSR